MWPCPCPWRREGWARVPGSPSADGLPYEQAEAEDRERRERIPAAEQQRLRLKDSLDQSHRDLFRKLALSNREQGVSTSFCSDLVEQLDRQREQLGRIEHAHHHVWRKVQGWDYLRARPLPHCVYVPEGVSTNAAFVVGPSVPRLRLAVAFALAARCLAFAAADRWSSPNDGEYPSWLWAIMVPGLCVSLWADVSAVRRMTVPFAWRAGEAGMQDFKMLGCCQVAKDKRCCWVAWAAAGGLSCTMMAAQNVSEALWAASTLALLRGGEAPRVRHLEAWVTGVFLFGCCRYLVPAVATVRGRELAELARREAQTCNVEGRAGGGQAFFSDAYNDDVALGLAEAACAGTLMGLSIPAAEAHILTSPSVDLALKSASMLASRLAASLAASQLPHCLTLWLQVAVVGARVDDLSDPTEAMAEVQSLVCLAASILALAIPLSSLRDFWRVARQLDLRVRTAKDTGEWESVAGAKPAGQNFTLDPEQAAAEQQRRSCRHRAFSAVLYLNLALALSLLVLGALSAAVLARATVPALRTGRVGESMAELLRPWTPASV